MKAILSCLLILWPAVAAAAPGDVTASVAAPGRNCTGLAHDREKLWVVDHRLDQLLAIDPESGEVRARHNSPGYRPAGLAFDGEHLWCADVRDALVYAVRPADGVVVRTIPIAANLPWGQSPRSVAWDGKALWVTDDQAKRIHRVDATDGTTLHEVAFPAESVDGMTFDGRLLWVADRLADRLYGVHPESGEVVVGLPSPGPHPSGLAFDGRSLRVVDYQTDRIDTVLPDDAAHLIEGEAREAWVLFAHQVRNFGPDPLGELDVYLAVPRDRTSQELLEPPRFEPPPASIETDRWEQPAARFHFEQVGAGRTVTIQMKARVRARAVQHVIYPHKVQSLWKIPAKVRRRYLEDAPKYDIRNPVIRQAVAEAVGSERNPYWIARKIYDHLLARMHYERVGGWDVAPKVLERGSGSCSEYTYVYIAMCRAAGLPARYVGSLVVRKDDASYDDVYHRWAEVYLPPYGWVPVDPSRGDKPTPAARAAGFGQLSHDFLITTEGGGGSELLHWSYNHNERWTCQGRCRVELEAIAEWSPDDPDAPRDATPGKDP